MKLANMCALEAYDFGLPGSSPGRATMCGKVEYIVLCKTSKGSNDQTTQKRKSVVHLKHHRNYTETKKCGTLETPQKLHRNEKVWYT